MKITTKQEAVIYLCNHASLEGMAPYEMKEYTMLSKLFGITRADYYNDLEAFPEHEQRYEGPAWTPNIGNKADNLANDLKREARDMKYLEKAIHEGAHKMPHNKDLLEDYKVKLQVMVELIDGITNLKEEK